LLKTSPKASVAITFLMFGAKRCSLVAIAWASVVLFGHGVWIDVAAPVLAVAFATFGGTAYQYFVEGREKRQVKRMFSRFVSRDVYEQLMADPSSARIGGARREMSVLFADIRGFTTFTERGRPEEVVAQLNEYFSRMVEVVFAHRGTVDKFVGDMVMALFGAPLADPGHADHAVQAALGMLDALGALNARWAAEGRPLLEIGIGVNSGDMVAGNIGSDTIMSYTVIGDAVNLGSRIESLNKEYGTRLIISDGTRARLKGRYDMKPLGAVTVKGKSEPVHIFEVLARQDRQE
jgi:adenylate cyclase